MDSLFHNSGNIPTTTQQPTYMSHLFDDLTTKLKQIDTIRLNLIHQYHTDLLQNTIINSQSNQASIQQKLNRLRNLIDLDIRTSISQELREGKKHLTENFMAVVNHYEKIKSSYDTEIQSLKDQIRRQYKVIALMKQEVQDLMNMLNYSENPQQTDAQEEPQKNKKEELQNHKKENINENRYHLNLQNMVLSVIEEETERTIISSQRSSSYRENLNSNEKPVNQEDKEGDQMDIKREFQDYNNQISIEETGNNIKSIERETHETFRKKNINEKANGTNTVQSNSMNLKSHQQSVFVYQQTHTYGRSLNTQPQHQNEQSNSINQSLFFDKQDNQSAERYHSYISSHPEFSQQSISNSSKINSNIKVDVSQSSQLETKTVLSHLGEALEIGEKISEKGDYFKSQTKRKKTKEMQWQSLSDRFMAGLQEVSDRNIGNNSKFETEESQSMEEYKQNPKTKQFLEQFRKTFSKCLNSMQIAKKHSTKNNMKHAYHSTNSKMVNTYHEFSIPKSSSCLDNSSQLRSRKDSKKSNKPTHQLGNKENAKAVDYMLRQLENQNKFLIGNKRIELKFEGDKQNGLRTGNGVLYYSNGLVYEGQFKNGLRQGYGILKFNHIEIYNGDWFQDEIEGQGKIRNCAIINKKKSFNSIPGGTSLLSRWISYSGQFKGSRFQGSGTLYLQGGQKFVGNFSNGIATGEGIIYRKNGEVEQGHWKNNTIVCEQSLIS